MIYALQHVVKSRFISMILFSKWRSPFSRYISNELDNSAKEEKKYEIEDWPRIEDKKRYFDNLLKWLITSFHTFKLSDIAP